MNEQFEKYITPVRELNNLAIANLEKLMDLQVKYIEDSVKVGLEQLKTASSINDVEGFKNYITTQVAVSKQLTERAIEDGRTVAELGNTYATEVQKVVKDVLKVN
jgi:phasin family protein